MAIEQAVQRSVETLHEVEAINHLDYLRCSLPRSIRICSYTIAADDCTSLESTPNAGWLANARTCPNYVLVGRSIA